MCDISTHSLTRRLTRKSGQRRSYLDYFNSQPHKEADIFGSFHILPPLDFNSQPHKEADVCRETDPVRATYFNSQPHKEADGNFRQKHIYPKLIFLLIIHISLIFYSNHHILNYFSCKLYVFPGANVLEYFCELTFRTIILRYL